MPNTLQNEFRETPCTVCGRDTLASSTALFVDVSADNPDGFLDEAFCSWEHFADWTGKGRPELEHWDVWYEEIGTLENWRWQIESAVIVGLKCLQAGLAAFGLYVLAQRWRATHPEEAARLGGRFPRLTRLLGAFERHGQVQSVSHPRNVRLRSSP